MGIFLSVLDIVKFAVTLHILALDLLSSDCYDSWHCQIFYVYKSDEYEMIPHCLNFYFDYGVEYVFKC